MQTLTLLGDVTQKTVTRQLAELTRQLAPTTTSIDLSKVNTVDSSAIALLLELQRRAGRRLNIIDAPAPLRALADLYDVAEVVSGDNKSLS